MPSRDDLSLLSSPLVKRIFLMFVLCALLPVLSLTVVTYQQITQQMQENRRESLHQLSKSSGMSIFNSISLVESELISLSHLIGKTPLTGRVSAGQFISAKEKETILSLAILKGPSQINVLFGKFPRLETWPQKLAYDKSLFFSIRSQSGARIFMAVPRTESPGIKEHLVAELNPAGIWEEPLRSAPNDSVISILTPSETVLVSSASISPEAVSETCKAASKSSQGFLEWQLSGKEYLANYWEVFLEGTFAPENLIVLASNEKNRATTAITRFSNYFLLITILTFLLVLLMSSIYVKKTLYPLAALKKGTRRIGQGDFKQPVVVKSNGEFKDLASSFNVMARQIDQHIEGLNQVSHTVRQVLTSLDRSALIKTVTSEFSVIVPSAQICFAIVDAEQRNRMETYTLTPSQGTLAVKAEVLLPEQEIHTLEQISDYFLCQPEQTLQTLFSSIGGEKKAHYLCLPLIQSQRLTGIIFLQPEDFDLTKELLLRARQVADQVAIALSNIRLIEELDLLNWGTLQALARTVDASSPWTAGHSERVASLAQEIGRSLGLSTYELDNLLRASLLHDIGKIGCPAALLDKPSSLTEEEYKTLQQHPLLGAKILEPISIYKQIIPAVKHHHERYNGSGYPDGLKATQICRDARILTLADIFDALSSHRPYRQGWPIEKVISYLEENRGIIFDPDILDTFLAQVLPNLDMNAFSLPLPISD